MTYSAVVESGSSDPTYTRFEARKHCGHAHRTIEAAEACGAKHYDSHYDAHGSWTANADWHGYTIHNQDGERVAQ
jgi:hypothetical protein